MAPSEQPQWAKVHAAEVIRTLERDVFPQAWWAVLSLPQI
jgi:hypothetical protein